MTSGELLDRMLRHQAEREAFARGITVEQMVIEMRASWVHRLPGDVASALHRRTLRLRQRLQMRAQAEPRTSV